MSADLVSIEADAAVEIAERLLAVPGISTLAVVERATQILHAEESVFVSEWDPRLS